MCSKRFQQIQDFSILHQENRKKTADNDQTQVFIVNPMVIGWVFGQISGK